MHVCPNYSLAFFSAINCRLAAAILLTSQTVPCVARVQYVSTFYTSTPQNIQYTYCYLLNVSKCSTTKSVFYRVSSEVFSSVLRIVSAGPLKSIKREKIS